LRSLSASEPAEKALEPTQERLSSRHRNSTRRWRHGRQFQASTAGADVAKNQARQATERELRESGAAREGTELLAPWAADAAADVAAAAERAWEQQQSQLKK
jgi:hypothetical protein